MSNASILLSELTPLLDAASEKGINLRGLSAGADGRIPVADYFRLQRDIAIASDDLTAVLSERRLTFKTGHFLIGQMQQATSLLAAIETLIEHINMMHGDEYNSLRFTDNRVRLLIDDTNFPYLCRDNTEFTELIGDCLLIKIHSLLDSLTNGVAEAALRRVRLKRKRGDTLRPQNSFWSVPIDYGGAAYELAFDYDMACRPIQVRGQVDLSADGVFSRVISYLEARESNSASRSITTRTMDLIDDGITRQADVARRLDMSVATLRRRLAEEGSHFRQLLLTARLRRAEAMLKRGCSVAHTTEELEYSDIRAFNRAFKRWKGLTPAAFAQANQS